MLPARAPALALLLLTAAASSRAADDDGAKVKEASKAEAAASKLEEELKDKAIRKKRDAGEPTDSGAAHVQEAEAKALSTDPEDLKRYLKKKERDAAEKEEPAGAAAGGTAKPPKAPPTEEERLQARALQADSQQRAATRPTEEVRAKRNRRIFGAINTAGQSWQKQGESLPASPSSGGKTGSSSSAALKPRASSGDPSRPASPADLALAAASGYKESFTALGLKPAPAGASVPAVHEDGSPAEPREVAALVELIGSEPKAMMRRPDFFRAVSRADFSRVKQAAAAGSEEPALRHAGVSPDERDVVRSQSCAGLSGGCAPFATGSYRRGDELPPEEIRLIARELKTASPAAAEPAAPEEESGSIFGEFDAEEDAQYKAWLEQEAAAPKKSVFKSLASILASASSAFGSRPAAEPDSGVGRASPASPSKSTETDTTLKGTQAPPGRPHATTRGAASPAFTDPGNEPPPARSALPWLLGVAAALAAAFWYRAKNRA